MSATRTEAMKMRFAEDLILELERCHEDGSSLTGLDDQLREADLQFRHVLFNESLILLDRKEFTLGNLPTDHIDELLVLIEAQLQRMTTTVKRARESLKMTGL